MDIRYLRQRIELAPLLAQIHATEWAHLYRAWDTARALADLTAEHADGGLPTTLVALQGERLCGSVSVVYDDLPEAPELNPWLANLYVVPACRGQGLATALLARAHQLLDANGVRRAYAFTETARGLLVRHGWSPLRAAVANGVPVEILVRERSGSR